MPPTPSQPGSPKAPEFAEAQQPSILDNARNRTTAALMVGATFLGTITGGFASRVSESNADNTSTPAVQVFDQHKLGGDISDYTNSMVVNTSSSKSDEQKVVKMAKECQTILIVNPSNPRQRRDHDKDKKVGRLDIIRGKINKYVFTRKNLGVKVCGFSGVVPGYAKSDGTIVYGRNIPLKLKKITKRKYQALDPKINGRSLEEVTAYTRE